jgi:hypothetical protein
MRSGWIAVVSLSIAGTAVAQTPTPTPMPEIRSDFEICYRRCTEANCLGSDGTPQCEARCSSDCSPAGIILGPAATRATSPGQAPIGGKDQNREEGNSLDPLALVAAAVLMVTPVFLYATDSPASVGQRADFDRFRFSARGGLGAAFPDDALV